MIREEQERLIVISGPSGTGKSTIIKKLLKKYPDQLTFSISTTTRQKRPNERDGKHYYFVSPEEFNKQNKQGQFIESALVHNAHYATSRKEIERIVKSKQYCILDIDVQGAVSIREVFPYSKRIFILPPSIYTLKTRLIKRGDTPEKEISLRLENTLKELSYVPYYQYFVVNNSIASSVKQIEKIIYEPLT